LSALDDLIAQKKAVAAPSAPAPAPHPGSGGGALDSLIAAKKPTAAQGQDAFSATVSAAPVVGPILGAMPGAAGAAKKGVSALSNALDYQRAGTQEHIFHGGSSDENRARLRQKLGLEDPHSFLGSTGLYSQAPHWNQGIVDLALDTVTDPLTYETLGFGAIPKGALRAAAPLLKTVAAKMPYEVQSVASIFHDFFTYAGAQKRAHGVDTVEHVVGAKSRALERGSGLAKKLDKQVETSLRGLNDDQQVKVFRWMNGEIPVTQLDEAEQKAATGMDRWRMQHSRIAKVYAPDYTPRQNYFPSRNEGAEGLEARKTFEGNLLDPFDPHTLVREGATQPIESAEHGRELLAGANRSRSRLAAGQQLRDELQKYFATSGTSKAIPTDIEDLFKYTVRGRGTGRTTKEAAGDLWRGFVNLPKTAVVGTGTGHIANILGLALTQPGGMVAAAKALPKSIALLARPDMRQQLLRNGIRLGAIGPNSEKSTAVIDFLRSLPGPLSLPGKAMQLINKGTWAFDEALADTLAHAAERGGNVGYQAGRSARKGLVDYEHVSPFTEAARNFMPFATFNTGIPKAVLGGVAKNPMRAAFLNRATQGGLYGNDVDTPAGKFRSYLPPAEIGRAVQVFGAPIDALRGDDKAASADLKAGATFGRKTLSTPVSIVLALLEKASGKGKPFFTYGLDPTKRSDALKILAQMATAGVPEARTALQEFGFGAFKPQSLGDAALQQMTRTLRLDPPSQAGPSTFPTK